MTQGCEMLWELVHLENRFFEVVDFVQKENSHKPYLLDAMKRVTLTRNRFKHSTGVSEIASYKNVSCSLRD